jgi:hypothetical protein
VRVRLKQAPDTTIGVDVAYFSVNVPVQHSEGGSVIDEVPTLSVVMPSPKYRVADADDKIDAFLAGGVPHKHQYIGQEEEAYPDWRIAARITETAARGAGDISCWVSLCRRLV